MRRGKELREGEDAAHDSGISPTPVGGRVQWPSSSVSEGAFTAALGTFCTHGCCRVGLERVAWGGCRLSGVMRLQTQRAVSDVNVRLLQPVDP
jgi:hypothetical protein